VDDVVRHFNSQTIKGTTFRRRDVNQGNYMQLLSQLYSTEDPDMIMNLGTSTRHSDRVRKAIWRFKEGDRVVALRAANYEVGQKKEKHEKPSVAGRFGPRTYIVDKLILKNNWKLFLVPCYALRTESGRRLASLFYQRELKLFLAAPPKT
jgi:hypothetical protein